MDNFCAQSAILYEILEVKNFLKKVGHVWLVWLALMAYVFIALEVFKQDIESQLMLTMFVLAPIAEEALFRKLPVLLAKRWNAKYEMMIISTVLFAFIHVNNYPYNGLYFSVMMQGAMGLACYYVCYKFGYIAAVVMHSKYNILIYIIGNMQS